MNDDRDLILDIYNTIGEEGAWARVLERLAVQFDAVGCIVFEAEGSGAERRLSAPYYSQGYDPEAVGTYLTRFHDQELAIQDNHAADLRSGDHVEIFGADLRKDEALKARDAEAIQWLAAVGIHEWSACFLNKDDPNRSRFSMQMNNADPSIVGRRQARTRDLLPHIAKALELGRPAAQLARLHRTLLEAMDRLRVGVCILDGKGRPVVSNSEFDRQRDRHPVFHIAWDGSLQITEPADGKQFADLVGAVATHGRFGARPRREAIVTSSDGSPTALCIEVAPLDVLQEMGSTPLAGAIVYSLDTSVPLRARTAPLKSIYGLTDAETEVLDLIAEGLTNPEIAEQRGRAPDTVNAQVKSILGKTRCANRTQLVRLLSGFAPMVFAAE
ncbi:MAG: helix-turn-helix transcriptional regulator [Pseudomonadota bacterium]